MLRFIQKIPQAYFIAYEYEINGGIITNIPFHAGSQILYCTERKNKSY